MKYKIAVFCVLRRGDDHKYYYHIITWETGKPWYIYETILYYYPRKKLSHHYILHLPGARDIYGTATLNFKMILETRTGIKEATKIVEYERTI